MLSGIAGTRCDGNCRRDLLGTDRARVLPTRRRRYLKRGRGLALLANLDRRCRACRQLAFNRVRAARWTRRSCVRDVLTSVNLRVARDGFALPDLVRAEQTQTRLRDCPA